jgi:Na+/phosphate symporter
MIMESSDETSSKYVTLDLILTVMTLLLVWGLFFFTILDNRNIYEIGERLLFLGFLIPSMVIWTCLGMISLRKYQKNEIE